MLEVGRAQRCAPGAGWRARRRQAGAPPAPAASAACWAREGAGGGKGGLARPARPAAARRLAPSALRTLPPARGAGGQEEPVGGRDADEPGLLALALGLHRHGGSGGAGGGCGGRGGAAGLASGRAGRAGRGERSWLPPGMGVPALQARGRALQGACMLCVWRRAPISTLHPSALARHTLPSPLRAEGRRRDPRGQAQPGGPGGQRAAVQDAGQRRAAARGQQHQPLALLAGQRHLRARGRQERWVDARRRRAWARAGQGGLGSLGEVGSGAVWWADVRACARPAVPEAGGGV